MFFFSVIFFPVCLNYLNVGWKQLFLFYIALSGRNLRKQWYKLSGGRLMIYNSCFKSCYYKQISAVKIGSECFILLGYSLTRSWASHEIYIYEIWHYEVKMVIECCIIKWRNVLTTLWPSCINDRRWVMLSVLFTFFLEMFFACKRGRLLIY